MKYSHSFVADDRAETAVSHMIFFIATVIIAMSVVLILSSNVQSITSASSLSGKMLSDQLRTDITIISDPEIIPYDAAEGYTFYAKNTGKSELSLTYVDIIIDGTLLSPSNVTLSVADEGTVWSTGDVLVIKAITNPDPLDSGDHSIRLVTENGKSDSISFKT